MKNRFVTCLLAVILTGLSPVWAVAHGIIPHGDSSAVKTMDTGKLMSSPAAGKYITYAAPTGRDVVIGRKNPLQTLEPEIITDDKGRKVKVFKLTVEDVKFEIYPGKTVMGWGFNGQIPGPTIRVTEGDRIRIVLTNNTNDEHTLHVHGQKKPMEMDGVPYLGQEPLKKGESYAYEFTVKNIGTSCYHCHVDGGHHVDMGMYGAFIVDPKREKLKYDREYTLVLDEWASGHKHVHSGGMAMDGSQGAGHGVVTEHMGPAPTGSGTMAAMAGTMDMGKPSQRDWYPKTYNPYTPVYDTFVINGRAFPYTEPLDVKEGERVRIRMINVGYEPHFMHTHSHKFLVVARDGSPVKNPQLMDTVEVGPGQRVYILLKADNPGVWPFHCHRLIHVANDHIYPGGMLTYIRYVK